MKIKDYLSVSSYSRTRPGAVLGILVTCIVNVVMLIGLTSLTIAGLVKLDVNDLLIFLVRMISVAIGVLVGTIYAKDKWIVTSVIISSGYAFVLIGFCLFAFAGTYQGVLPCVFSIILGWGLGSFIRLKLQFKPRRKIKITK